MRITSKISALFSFLVLTLTCGGVYATFNYAVKDADNQNEIITPSINEFNYLFPDTPEGKKHEQLTNNILNGTTANPDVGLNNPDSRINQVISNRSGTIWGNKNVLGSCDGWEKDNLSKLFDDETKDMTFLIYFPDGVSDTYYLFTTTVDLGSNENNPNVPYGEYVEPICRTVLRKNSSGEYEAIEAEMGKAISKKYNNYLGTLISSAPSFNPSTWVKI